MLCKSSKLDCLDGMFRRMPLVLKTPEESATKCMSDSVSRANQIHHAMTVESFRHLQQETSTSHQSCRWNHGIFGSIFASVQSIRFLQVSVNQQLRMSEKPWIKWTLDGDFNVFVPGLDIGNQSANLSIQSGLHVSNRPLCLFPSCWGTSVRKPSNLASHCLSQCFRDGSGSACKMPKVPPVPKTKRRSSAVLPEQKLNDLCKEQQLKVPSHS